MVYGPTTLTTELQRIVRSETTETAVFTLDLTLGIRDGKCDEIALHEGHRRLASRGAMRLAAPTRTVKTLHLSGC